MLEKNEEKLRETTLEIIKLQLKNNFFNLVCDICEYNNSTPYEETKEITGIKNEIFSLAVSLEETLKKDIDERDLLVDKINKLKKDISNAAKPLFLYSESQELIFQIVKSKYMLAHFKEEEILPDVDRNEFAADCSRYVGEPTDEYTALHRKSAVMGCLPVKMTTENYNDYLRKSLTHTYSRLPYDTAKILSRTLKEKFAPFKAEQFGESFTITAESIKALLDTDFSNKSSAQLMEIIESLQDTQNNTETVISDLSMYFNDLNYLLNIFSFCVDADYLIDNDMTAKDILYSLKTLNDRDDLEAFAEPILEKAEQKFEEIFNLLKEREKDLNKISSAFSDSSFDSLSQSAKVCITTFDIIMRNHYQELNQTYETEYINVSKNAPLCTDEQINEIINDFTDYIAQCRNSVSISVFKELKRLFMKLIPCPLTNADFMYTLQNTIAENTENLKAYVIYSEIAQLMEQDGFINTPEQPEPQQEQRQSLNFSVKL